MISSNLRFSIFDLFIQQNGKQEVKVSRPDFLKPVKLSLPHLTGTSYQDNKMQMKKTYCLEFGHFVTGFIFRGYGSMKHIGYTN